MRWYWKDFESMENWVHSGTHRQWWINFIKDSGGNGFWHESYPMNGGMEGIYADVTKLLGLQAFAPIMEVKSSIFSARSRTSLGSQHLNNLMGLKSRISISKAVLLMSRAMAC